MSGQDKTAPKTVVLHLVSHASGELVEMLARNSAAQLDGVTVERTLYKMVRTVGQLPEILAQIGETPGFVIHSIADPDVRATLEEACHHLRAPCLSALEPFVDALARHFRAEIRYRSSTRDPLFDDYYRRVEAMKYALGHDDGAEADSLDDVEVILVGVSRATKTPTCMYLASRGIKAANVPLVPGLPLPDGVLAAKGAFIVGLTVDPNRLARVRKARLEALAEDRETDYSDIDRIAEEVREARRLCARHNWPVIDVTHRSVEQTASMIIEMLDLRRAEREAPGAS
jgi:regulator of PEP synthase PpsR (kinase-PPPase family)